VGGPGNGGWWGRWLAGRDGGFLGDQAAKGGKT